MSPPTIIYEKEGGVARVGLNRPEKLNAYNTQMRDELYQAREAVRDDSEVRAVLPGEKLAGCFSYDNLNESVDALFNRIELNK